MLPIPIWQITDEHLRSFTLLGYGVYTKGEKSTWCWFTVKDGHFINNKRTLFHPTHYFPSYTMLEQWKRR